jgi:glycosyltransferase involved in cell wall biosynthesis
MRPVTVGLECEALEGPTWGMGRQIRKLLEELAARNDLAAHFRFILYSNGNLPADPLYDHPLFVRRPTGLKAVLGPWAPSSFSIHYYVLLPLRLWWDSVFGNVRAMYYPNYMLPIIHPPHVASLVMLTDDIFREVRNSGVPFRHRIAYRIFATFWARRRATRIMAISHASAAALAEMGIAPGRIAVNEMGVIEPVPVAEPAVRCDFLFVGQAFPRRRLKESLESFVRIAAGRPSLTFRFIGRDKYTRPTIAPLIEDINRRLGRTAVTAQEYVPDAELSAAYRSAAALVYVSDTEGFGMPPIEALSCGTPPVIADTPVNREIYGDAAFFVPQPFSGQGIEEAMRRALDDDAERRRILAAGPGIIARYSWGNHATRFLKIIGPLTHA